MLISLATVTLAESVMTTISASPVEQAMQVMEVWPSVESSGDIFPSQNRNNNTATVGKPEQSVRYRAGPQYSSLPCHGRISIEVYIWSLMSLSWVLRREKTILLAWASKGVDLGLNSQFCWAAAQLFLPGWSLGFTCPNNALFPGWFQHKHTLVYQA